MKKLTKIKLEIAFDSILLGISAAQLMLGSILFIIFLIWMYRLLWNNLLKYEITKNPDPIYFLYEPDSQRKAMIY